MINTKTILAALALTFVASTASAAYVVSNIDAQGSNVIYKDDKKKKSYGTTKKGTKDQEEQGGGY